MIFINAQLDMNNEETLGFYIMLQLFRDRKIEGAELQGAALQFPSILTSQQRQTVHTLALRLKLDYERDCDGFIRVSHPSHMSQDPH